MTQPERSVFRSQRSQTEQRRRDKLLPPSEAAAPFYNALKKWRSRTAQILRGQMAMPGASSERHPWAEVEQMEAKF